MTARRTPWTTLLLAFVIGFVAGSLLALLTRGSSTNLLGTTIVVPIILVLLAIVVLILGWQVRRYAKGKNKKFDVRRGTLTLVMAKALEIVGGILAGWYLGQLLVVVAHPASEWAKSVLVECGVASAAALFDLVAGIIAEWWCTLPPDEGPDNPHRQNASQNPSRQKAANNAASKRAR